MPARRFSDTAQRAVTILLVTSPILAFLLRLDSYPFTSYPMYSRRLSSGVYKILAFGEKGNALDFQWRSLAYSQTLRNYFIGNALRKGRSPAQLLEGLYRPHPNSNANGEEPSRLCLHREEKGQTQQLGCYDIRK